MKKLLFPVLVVFALALHSCDIEPADINNLESVEGKAKLKNKNQKTDEAEVVRQCDVIDADRCPNEGRQPTANFWWPESETDYNNPSTYFGSNGDNTLQFTEYNNGTAQITGSTVMGSCVVEVNVWLKDKKSWSEWSAEGGGHKKEGCAGDLSNEELMNFYVIDGDLSYIVATGGDCIAEGMFGVEQRPDPNDSTTPNYGAHLGPGGANYDSEINAEGLSTWGWITDKHTGERLWVMDFNFKLKCDQDSFQGCETAFARTTNGENCFIDNGFNRWGWTIGPLSEGTEESYEIYAAAGQCDIAKGTLVGTVDVSYIDGDVSITYNIEDYEVQETHSYAGNEMFPTNKKGKPTVAPGQYSIGENLEGDIYVIAHAVVCGKE